jgi:hypothetical protein
MFESTKEFLKGCITFNFPVTEKIRNLFIEELTSEVVIVASKAKDLNELGYYFHEFLAFPCHHSDVDIGCSKISSEMGDLMMDNHANELHDALKTDGLNLNLKWEDLNDNK